MSVRDHSRNFHSKIEEKRVDVDGNIIPYLSAGDSGPALVLLHGAASESGEWRDIMARLSHDRRIFAPDMIGFGESPRGEDAYTVDSLAKFLIGFVRAIGLTRASLGGHSLGGRVCLEAARTAPKMIEDLVLISPLGFGEVSRLGKIINLFFWAVNRLLNMRLPYPKLSLEVNEPPEMFQGIDCRTLLIWGSRDMYFPMSHADRALESISNASLIVYRGVGHAPHRSWPSRFASDVIAFGESKFERGGCTMSVFQREEHL